MLSYTSAPTLPKNRIPPTNDLPHMAFLWRSVLAQSIKDIYSGETGPRLEVIRWLKTRDFETVCDLAHVEYQSMREQMASLLAMPEPLARKYGKLLIAKVI